MADCPICLTGIIKEIIFLRKKLEQADLERPQRRAQRKLNPQRKLEHFAWRVRRHIRHGSDTEEDLRIRPPSPWAPGTPQRIGSPQSRKRCHSMIEPYARDKNESGKPGRVEAKQQTGQAGNRQTGQASNQQNRQSATKATTLS